MLYSYTLPVIQDCYIVIRYRYSGLLYSYTLLVIQDYYIVIRYSLFRTII